MVAYLCCVFCFIEKSRVPQARPIWGSQAPRRWRARNGGDTPELPCGSVAEQPSRSRYVQRGCADCLSGRELRGGAGYELCRWVQSNFATLLRYNRSIAFLYSGLVMLQPEFLSECMSVPIALLALGRPTPGNRRVTSSDYSHEKALVSNHEIPYVFQLNDARKICCMEFIHIKGFVTNEDLFISNLSAHYFKFLFCNGQCFCSEASTA